MEPKSELDYNPDKLNKIIHYTVLLIVGLVIGMTLAILTTAPTEEFNNMQDKIEQLEFDNNGWQVTNTTLNQYILDRDATIIKLLEDKEYIRREKDNAIEKRNELQEGFNELFGEATTCFWANHCKYFEESCLEKFKDHYTGQSAQEIHMMYSDECDRMINNWDKYYELDNSVGDEQ